LQSPTPTSAWVIQQLREATPFEIQPEYLLHDNDSIFLSKYLQEFLANSKITSVRTSYRSPWQNGICERALGILRRELLDYIIPFNEEHLYNLLGEYNFTKYGKYKSKSAYISITLF
jgi:transposase InsO family protein